MVYSYLIECSRTKVCKIGKSNKPLKRFETIKTSNPFVKLVGVSELKEQDLHKQYDEFRFAGEWFDFPDNIKSEVYSLFKPLNELNTVNDNFVNDKFLEKIKMLDENFDAEKVDEFTDNLYKKLGMNGYRELLHECCEFNDLVSRAMYLSL